MVQSKHVLIPVAFLLALLSACVNDPVKVNSFTQNNNLPLITEHNVDALYTDSARIKFHLTAPQVDRFEGINPRQEMPKGLKVEFFSDSETVDSYLTANYAIYKEKENLMVARYDVVCVNTKGEKLNTEELIWDQAKRRIHTDKFVRITTADQIIEGTGLDSDERFEEYEIKDISGTINIKDIPK